MLTPEDSLHVVTGCYTCMPISPRHDGIATSGNGCVWIDLQVFKIFHLFSDMEAVNTKENPVRRTNPPVSNPVFASQTIDRDMMHYNIYRDGELVGDQQPGVHEYMDAGLDWGTYTYHVTAMYDDHESIATNTVEVLSNPAQRSDVDFTW